MQPNSEQRNGALFKATFLRLLLERFPSWRSSISDSAEPYYAAKLGWTATSCRYPSPRYRDGLATVQFRP